MDLVPVHGNNLQSASSVDDFIYEADNNFMFRERKLLKGGVP
jgi:hypothetical protein